MPVRPGLLSGFRLPSPTKASLEAHGVGFSAVTCLCKVARQAAAIRGPQYSSGKRIHSRVREFGAYGVLVWFCSMYTEIRKN